MDAAAPTLSPRPSCRTPLETGDPAEDGRLFRRCLGQYGTGIIATLLDRGMLARSPAGAFTLTEAGRQLREAIRTRWQVFQREQISGIPESDIRATARTLAKLIGQNRTKS